MQTLKIFLADYLIFIEVTIALAVFVTRPRKRWLNYLFLILVASFLALLLAHLASLLYYHPRPFVTLGVQPLVKQGLENGFPSDHMLLASTVAGLTFLIKRPYGVVLGVLALLVGIGRVLTLVHAPVDILGSAVIAAISVLAAHYISHFVRLRWRR